MKVNDENKNLFYVSTDNENWIKIDIPDNEFSLFEEKDIYNFKIDNHSFKIISNQNNYDLLINSFSFNNLKLKDNNKSFKNNFINIQNKRTSRNIKSKLKYQSSDELLKKAINNEKLKTHRNMQSNFYTNDNFKNKLPDFARHLPKSIYHTYQYKNKNMNKYCSICLEQYFIGQEICTLPCFHFFHIKCISDWFKKKAICPICLSPIN